MSGDNLTNDSSRIKSLVEGLVFGTPNKISAAYGGFSAHAGLQEELLRESGIIAGRILAGSLNSKNSEKFLGICTICVTTSLMSEKDLDEIVKIIERNII